MRAFSLIELMVVIAIVSILAGVSVPVYKNYIYRSNAVEALNLMRNYANQINIWYSTRSSIQSWGTPNANISIPVTSKCCSSVNYWMNGTAGITFIHFWVTWNSGKMLGSGDPRLYLMAWADPSNPAILKWQCAYDTRGGLTIDTNLIPATCLNAWNGNGSTF